MVSCGALGGTAIWQQRFGDLGDRTERQEADHQQTECRKAAVQPFDEDIEAGAPIRRDLDARPIDFR